MKYFIKAAVHELSGLLLVLAVLALVLGFIALVVYVAGAEYAPGILFLLAFAFLQVKIVWDKAQHLKRRNPK